jgi:hypothetical protein
VLISGTGTASTHLVDLSITVNKYLLPLAETGNGPTRSTCKCANRRGSRSIGSTAARTCVVTLLRKLTGDDVIHTATAAAGLRKLTGDNVTHTATAAAGLRKLTDDDVIHAAPATAGLRKLTGDGVMHTAVAVTGP